MADILAAFPGATVVVRPATPVPDEERLGDWIWSRSLPPKRWRRGSRRRAFWREDLPADAGDADRYGEDWDRDWVDLGPDPNACVYCGRHCDPRDLAGCSRRLDGLWEHLECWLAAHVGWTPSELTRKQDVEAGGTVVANRRKGAKDDRLIGWAQSTGRLVSIGRDSPWGNPYVLPRRHTLEQRIEAIRRYRADSLGRPDLLARLPELRGTVLRLPELRGTVLLCWCHPLPCHGDVLAELVRSGCWLARGVAT